MKIFLNLILLFSITVILSCGGRQTPKTDDQTPSDTIMKASTDTGFTGIKQYRSNKYLIKEVTFKNGVREGTMKSFYESGKLRQEFMYKAGLREDSAIWYYEEGQVFRLTPYNKDTVDGIQKQFYRNGNIKAKIGYKKGLRTLLFEEYTMDGKLIKGYPELEVNVKDEYKTNGILRLKLELLPKSKDVKYFVGDLSTGVYDTLKCRKIETAEGIGLLELKKGGTPNPPFPGIIAEFLTTFGNKYLIYKKIELPYNDLK